MGWDRKRVVGSRKRKMETKKEIQVRLVIQACKMCNSTEMTEQLNLCHNHI